jgi:hypothetical protein
MAKLTIAARTGSVLLAVAVLIASAAATAAPESGDRVLRAAEGFTRDRPGSARLDRSELTEVRTSAKDTAAMSKLAGPLGEAPSIGDHWIYDADVELFDDIDGDGYYRFLSLRIDADTFFASSYVYAVIYLSEDGETFEHFFSTDDFEINGAISDDEYFVETELVSGYPPGLYDVLIELYDADLGLYMDEFGPLQSAALELLPLEDATFDAVEVIVVTEGGGGAASWWLLAGLLGAALTTRRTPHRTRVAVERR